MHWLPYPFVRFVIALILGIHLGNAFPFFQDKATLVMLFTFLSYLLIYYLKSKTPKRSLSILLGITGLICMGTFGTFLTYLHNDLKDEQHYSKVDAQHLYATIIKPPKRKPKSIELIINIHSAYTMKTKQWKDAHGKAILYIPLKDSSTFAMGDGIQFPNHLEDISPPGNPYAFDYKTYLAHKNIFQRQYTKHFTIEKGHLSWFDKIQKIAYKTRDYCYSTLLEKLGHQKEASLVAALAFGIKEHLEEDLNKAYRQAGVTHVLAVSGLHVGLIFLILQWMFGWLYHKASGQKYFLVIMVVFLSFYAFLTGLSPSVLRASLMFVLIQISIVFIKHYNTYNSLAFSAFLLLLMDPMMIYNIGFQLSYLAVFGIAYLFPKISPLWTPNNRIIAWAFDATVVSLSAQLTTLPLSIYYFHQYPIYGFLANLLVIPAGFVILVGGLAVVAFSLIPYLSVVSEWLGYLLRWVVWFTNAFVSMIENWQFSAMTISITSLELWLWFGLLILLICYLQKRQVLYIWLSVSLLMFWTGVKTLQFYTHYHQQKLLIYDTPNHNNIVMIEGTKAYFLTDSLFFEDPKTFEYNLKNHFLHMGIQDTSNYKQEATHKIPDANFLSLGDVSILQKSGKTFALIHQKPSSNSLSFLKKCTPDYIVIQKKSIYNLNTFKNISPKCFILDNTVPWYLREKLKAQAQKEILKIWDIHEDGFFVITS